MYDPTKPANGSPNSSAEMRGQLTALKALIDAIPAGPPGPQGPPGASGAEGGPGPAGEVSQQDLINERVNHAQNPSGVALAAIAVNDPPTQNDFLQLMEKVNELITALRREP